MKLSQLKQQIEELDAKATKGPWRNGPDPYDAGILSKGGTLVAGLGPTESYDTFIANRDFIALSRTVTPELLRRLLVAEEAFGNILKMTAGHYGIDKTANAALKTIRGEEE